MGNKVGNFFKEVAKTAAKLQPHLHWVKSLS